MKRLTKRMSNPIRPEYCEFVALGQVVTGLNTPVLCKEMLEADSCFFFKYVAKKLIIH